MRQRRLATTLLQFVLVICIVIQPTAGTSAEILADDPETEAGGPAEHESGAGPVRQGSGAAGGPGASRPGAGAPHQAGAPSGNNIIGLNVARLRRDRYIWAAAELVNANGGDWGYLTVVFTAAERDTAQGEVFLQQLLDRCFEQHLQPIIRVATRFDVETETWSRPEPDDAERWRAFLEKGRWPTKHVWVIAGNEPNLGREWGGAVDSAAYAEYLSHFLDVFADSERFRVVNGPLDASNGTELPTMQDAYEFLAGMEAAVPGLFARLAGWSSNPYSVPHHGDHLRYTHRAYEAELAAIGRDMPVLITEAGHLNTGDEHEIAQFYEQAFRDWMADPRVVAVTPLFWHPDRGVYWMFDFDQHNRIVDKSPTYDLIRRLPRPRGSPEYAPEIENVARGDAQPSRPRIENVALRPAPVVADAAQAAPPEAPAEAQVPGEEATATPGPTAPPAPPTATPVPATATSAPPTPTSVPPTATPVPPTATRPPHATATRPPATATPVPPAAGAGRGGAAGPAASSTTAAPRDDGRSVHADREHGRRRGPAARHAGAGGTVDRVGAAGHAGGGDRVVGAVRGPVLAIACGPRIPPAPAGSPRAGSRSTS